MSSRAAFVSAWLVLAGGCSSTHSSSITAAQACADLAMALCNLRSACSLPQGVAGVGASVLEAYGDLETCVGREALACTNRLSAPQTGDGPAGVETCVNRFSSYSCSDFFDNLPPSDCFVLGARADGAACAFDAQCQSGFCNGTKTAVCGSCGMPPATGEDCSTSNCMRGDRCLSPGDTCVTAIASDGTCDDTHACEPGLSCVPNDAAAGGTCQATGTHVGATCAGSSPGCDGTRGLYCGGASACVALAYSATPGTPCGQLADGTRVACVAGDCYTDSGRASGTDMGTCKPFAADGDACDTTVGPGCMAPARCVTAAGSTAGTCVIPLASMCAGG